MRKYTVILGFACAKLLLHLWANTQYGFHRDEFLYLEQGRHLSWGYMECPPLISVFAAIAHWFDAPLWLVRLFPSLAGLGIIIMIGKAVMDFGGSKWAQALACMGYLCSAAFLRSNMLFQPVTFDQFAWFLLALSVLYLIKTQDSKYWYAIGIFAGLGLMAKYSMSFYILAFGLAWLFSKERHWLKTRYPYLAMGIAFLIFLPNLYWQFAHNFPLMTHMKELRETQLIHTEAKSFLLSQLMMHFSASLIWVVGLLTLFLGQQWVKYRPIGIAFLIVVGLLLMLSGKDYYTLGAYPVLFIFGGLALDNFLTKNSYKYALSFVMLFTTIVFLPYALPVLSLPGMTAYCALMKDKLGLRQPLVWEDGSLHTLPQDYADMNGWEEMTWRLSKIYYNLPEKERVSCMLYGGSYSHVMPFNYYRKKYKLPEMYSLHNSSLMWMRDTAHFDRQLMIDDVRNFKSTYFQKVVLLDSIQDPYAREKGYIYYRTEPKGKMDSVWRTLILEKKAQYDF